MFDVVSVLQLPAFILHKVALLSGALHLALAECLVAVLSTPVVRLPRLPILLESFEKLIVQFECCSGSAAQWIFAMRMALRRI